ncbi:hypothetical protein FA95DRAFT_1611537 [Auriscalpium vulgare]|uniref:Uncharacterized protein n=1 Tax=Auriscalpium vulgare TaxID=40419 RepID=A0ACB8R9F8_9AGAM|nr:hypothetical protein FA95DRAFT_1611537 [Auriscalpium vulgare]
MPLQASAAADRKLLARFDPVFTPYKDELSKATTLLTLDCESGTLVEFCYPCYDDGQPVPLDELLSYWETHDMSTPVCFCFVKTGEAKETVLFLARWPNGEHYGSICLSCEDGACGYFATVTRVRNSNPDLALKNYPLLAQTRRRRIPARIFHTPPTTPKRQRTVGYGTTGLILGGPTMAPRSSSIVSATPSTRSVTASPGKPRTPKTASTLKSEASEAPKPPFLGEDAVFTQAMPKPFPIQFESAFHPFEEGFGQYPTGDHKSNPAFTNSLLRIDGAGTTTTCSPMPDDVALDTLLRTADRFSTGITTVDLARALSQCIRCRRIFLSARIPAHMCLPKGWMVQTYDEAMADSKEHEVPTSQPHADHSCDEATEAADKDEDEDDADTIPMPAKKKVRLAGPVPKRSDWAFRRSVDKLASGSGAGRSGGASGSRGAGASGGASGSRAAGGSGGASGSRAVGGSGGASGSRAAGGSGGASGRRAAGESGGAGSRHGAGGSGGTSSKAVKVEQKADRKVKAKASWDGAHIDLSNDD